MNLCAVLIKLGQHEGSRPGRLDCLVNWSWSDRKLILPSVLSPWRVSSAAVDHNRIGKLPCSKAKDGGGTPARTSSAGNGKDWTRRRWAEQDRQGKRSNETVSGDRWMENWSTDACFCSRELVVTCWLGPYNEHERKGVIGCRNLGALSPVIPGSCSIEHFDRAYWQGYV
jgi:hypothetical protein